MSGAHDWKPSGETAADSHPSVNEALTAKFYQALNHHAGQAPGPEKFAALEAAALRYGYQNLPSFSFELLARARHAEQAGQTGDSLQYIGAALNLSRSDARVRLAAASFLSVVGLRKAVLDLCKGAAQALFFPILLGTIIVNASLGLLISVTIALFVLCAVELTCSAEQSAELCAGFFKGPRRQLFGKAFNFALLVMPLFFGILAALGCWSLFLAASKREFKKIAAAAGLLLILWAVLLPGLSRIGAASRNEANMVLEEMANDGFSPNAEAVLQQQLRKNPADAAALVALAARYHSHGMSAEAEKLYKQASPLIANDPELRSLVDFNLAVVQYEHQRYNEAKQLLTAIEAQRFVSFELYYNLALASLSLMDMEGYRSYFAKAKEEDRERIQELEDLNKASRALIIGRPPLGRLYGRIFHAALDSGSEGEALLERQRSTVTRPLLIGPPLLMGVMGALVLFAALFFLHPARTAAGGETQRDPQSRIWVVLPAGLMLAGGRPFSGLVLLTAMIVPIVFWLDYPVKLYPALPSGSFGDLALFVSSALFAVTAGLSYAALLRRRG